MSGREHRRGWGWRQATESLLNQFSLASDPGQGPCSLHTLHSPPVQEAYHLESLHEKCGTKHVPKLLFMCFPMAPNLSGTCGSFWPAPDQVCTFFGRGPHIPPTSAGSHSPLLEGSISVCLLGSSPGIRHLGDFQFFAAEHAGAVEISS